MFNFLLVLRDLVVQHHLMVIDVKLTVYLGGALIDDSCYLDKNSTCLQVQHATIPPAGPHYEWTSLKIWTETVSPL